MSKRSSEPASSETLSPEVAFALLGNDTRVDIIQALWEAFEPGWGRDAVPFSELYEQVDIRDTGNFTYHLEKLTGHFVRKTDAGYELTQTGLDVVRAVVSGSVTATPALSPIAVDATCPLCGGPVEISYRDDSLRCRCRECDGIRYTDGESGYFFLFPLPSIGLQQHETDEALRTTIVYNFHKAASMLDGICPICSSNTRTSVEVCPDHEPGGENDCPNCDQPYMATALLSCPTCKRWFFFKAGGAVLTHPQVTAFYHDHGIEHRFASWESFVRSHNIDEELVSEEPLRLRITIPAGNDELRLTVDDELNVIDIEE